MNKRLTVMEVADRGRPSQNWPVASTLMSFERGPIGETISMKFALRLHESTCQNSKTNQRTLGR